METIQEQREFFDRHWPALRDAIEQGGAKSGVSIIESFDGDLERRALYAHARAGLVMDEWEGKSFDPYIAVCDAGIAELLSQAAAAEDEDTKKARLNGAHAISFNLAADLADCWPGDDAPRTREHFERGLKAAEDCLGWCDPNNSQRMSIDWWAKGMHQLSLGMPVEARESWEKSLDYAKRVADEEGSPTEVSSEAGFGVILGSGYVGIAVAAAGDPAGAERLNEVISVFQSQLSDDDKRDDAQFGIDQLETVRDEYLQ